MIDAAHLRKHIVRPALETLGLWSESAEALVMGTAAAESRLRYLVQLGGPALGLWQMEPSTHSDCWASYLDYRTELAGKVMVAAGRGTKTPRLPPHDWLVFNLRYAAAICRVHYLRDPHPLPAADDVRGMAETWKRAYNTALGAGTVEHFVNAYELVQ